MSKTEDKARFAPDAANTFTETQSIETTGDETAVQHNRTDAGNLLNLWSLAGALKWLYGVLDSDDSWILKNAAETGGITITQDAQILALADKGLSYDSNEVKRNGGLVGVSASKTLGFGDIADIQWCSTSGITLTVPPFSTTAFPTGTEIQLSNSSGGSITVSRGAGVSLFANGGGTVGGTNKDYTIALGQNAVLRKYSTDSWILIHSGGVT